MTQPVEQFIQLVTAALPHAALDVDRPARADGPWFLDLRLDGHDVNVEWRPAHGFGVSAPALESGYGEGPEEVFRNAQEAAARVAELLRTRTHTHPPPAVLLRDLRALSKLTQEELAQRLGISQAAVSKMERRRDMTLSTLRRLIEAMGGELEVVARFPTESVRIAQFEDDADGVRAPARAACDHVRRALVAARLAPPADSSASPYVEAAEAHVRDVCSLVTRLRPSAGSAPPFDIVVDEDGRGSGPCELAARRLTLSRVVLEALARRLEAPATEVCAVLVSHEIGHLLAHRQRLHSSELLELEADRFAGWVEGRLGKRDAATGAATFYELGCRRAECSHPHPTARLSAFLQGFDAGRARRPHDLGGAVPRRDGGSVFLDSLVLRVSALDDSRAFYESLGLGVTEEQHGNGPRHFAAQLENGLLELYPQREQTAPRLGFRVGSVCAVVDSLERRGLAATIRRRSAHGLLLRDPGGNDVEVVEAAGASPIRTSGGASTTS